MKHTVFGKKVRGATHVHKNTECQDSYRKMVLDDGTIILAVADGHGSERCPYSKTGSRFAVNVFCDIMRQIYESYKEQPEQLPSYLNREGDTQVSRAIEVEWKKRVLRQHRQKKRDIGKLTNGEDDLLSVYKLYGSTLLGLLIAKNFVFGFQLGDGDICYVNENSFERVVNPDKILGVESHSISKKNSWEQAITVVRGIAISSALPAMFSLSTDGYENSHKSEEEFQKTIKDYLNILKEHGSEAVNESLAGWLTETSEMGCGDDITMLIAYFEPDDAEISEKESEELANEGDCLD